MKLSLIDGKWVLDFGNGDRMIFATKELGEKVMDIIDRYVQDRIESAIVEHEEYQNET